MADWLAWAARELRACGDDARLEAEVLLGHLLACNRAGLVVRADDALDAHTALRYAALVERRVRGEPVAYLTGQREFWSLPLQVSPAVLIPRPDTELLVEWALQRLRGIDTPVIADLGTGSGAIALALASELPQARVVATDASEAALEQARHNAAVLGLQRVEFRPGDWFEPLAEERFDLILSNPPYVADADPHLAELRYEPRRALVAGADGLDALRRIAAGARAHLRPRGALLLEHGSGQGEAVRELLREHGFDAVETRRDLAGHERASGGEAA
ncbi:MAG: peptide chain release factor N(5)-glutamine methyltransferase [Nevskia sp.]|nr:peptide chain release factor N(5)-glutamine methyltransferase [Nevskia sp.]